MFNLFKSCNVETKTFGFRGAGRLIFLDILFPRNIKTVIIVVFFSIIMSSEGNMHISQLV